MIFRSRIHFQVITLTKILFKRGLTSVFSEMSIYLIFIMQFEVLLKCSAVPHL